MEIPVIEFNNAVSVLENKNFSYLNDYVSMFSTWYGGIITDPKLMLIPIDDHMVHRGDGVFEAIKCVNGNIYQLSRHLTRLQNSLKKINLKPPYSIEEIEEIIIKTIKVGGEKDCIIRLYISRGPGDFSPKPGKTIGSQLYVVVTKSHPVEERRIKNGCSLKLSKIPIKDPFFATIKSCNYLPNVLMNAECEIEGCDYVVTVMGGGKIGEGATENFGIITNELEFIIPPFNQTLTGTTIVRAMEFAKELVESEILKDARQEDLYISDFISAKEILVFSTTIDVLAITEFEGIKVGEGKPGKFFHIFRDLFQKDISQNKDLLTPVW